MPTAYSGDDEAYCQCGHSIVLHTHWMTGDAEHCVVDGCRCQAFVPETAWHKLARTLRRWIRFG